MSISHHPKTTLPSTATMLFTTLRTCMRAALLFLTMAVLFSSLGSAQQWTVGAAAGGGFYRDASISNSTGSVSAGIGPQIAASVVGGDDLYRFLGGEIRYTYRAGDLQLKSSAQTATMAGSSQAVHYDLLLHATPREARIRPFAAGGGGVKYYRGTGQEQAFQPLSGFGFLTKTHQHEPLISFGGGVKCRVTRHVQFRVDVRDYVTPFPDKVIVPAPSAKTHGWLHDFVSMAGLSYVF